jgi:hypothetical protein
MTNWNDAQPIDPDVVPSVITTYLRARATRQSESAVAEFASDGFVSDEGHTYTGPENIASWIANAASEYTYTVELTQARQVDSDHYDLLQHLEGNFPGGVADLHFRFGLRDGKIAQLVIEP